MRVILVRVRVGARLIFRRFGDLFVGESISWFLFEGDHLGNVCKCLDVGRSRYVYDYWDFYDVCLKVAVNLKGLLKLFVDGVYVVYDRLCISICGIFLFNEL